MNVNNETGGMLTGSLSGELRAVSLIFAILI